MRKLTALAVLALAFGIPTAAQADCVLSAPPVIPDGATAPEADMVAAQQALRTYVTETQEYLACLENENRGRAGRDWTRDYNEASSQMEKLASDFNKQLRAFKSR